MNTTEQLFEFLSAGVSSCHVVDRSVAHLKENGFLPLSMKQAWKIERGGKYYIRHHDTTLAAFTVGGEYQMKDMIRIGAAHTDFPCFKIKPNPEVVTHGYGKVNVECYGGGIWNTWLDRPLSIAGRVALKSNDVFAPKIRLVDFQRPLLVIPNLAIHMNREVNKGIELNRQIDLMPVLACIPEDMKQEKFFLKLLAEELQVETEDILDYELTVYVAETPVLTGAKKEFISSPRLDNLTSVYALLEGITQEWRAGGINLAIFFDHEEIGSRSKQGAASLLLRDILSRIVTALGADAKEVQTALYQSMLLSVDVAHALHPNQPGKMDVTNQPVLNGGFCLKEASSQSYATDCKAVAIVQQICEANGISYQKFVNRSDIAGGSTLGAIASALLPVPTVDLGIPVLAMHSAREMMGANDIGSLTACIRAWYGMQ